MKIQSKHQVLKTGKNLNRFAFVVLVLILFTACKKDDDPDFTPDFNITYLQNNYVRFENRSVGEYYSLIWNFGNGESDTTTDKKKIYQVYYPGAGNYQVSLKLVNYSGTTQSTSKTVSLEEDDLIVSFTAEELQDDPKRIILTNTTQGSYNSFKWLYEANIIEDEQEHLAYFPYAGSYTIELIVIKNNIEFSETKNIVISQDDPNLNFQLVWSEEFDYTGLPDGTKWNMETGGNGWGNNELQYYTNTENNAYVGNGVLTITAREESYGGRDYTSARITTQNKFDFKYGKIEAKIKLPYGQGLWPAFWMLGDDFNTTGWPACGEIDIMEMVGGTTGDKTCYATLHWEDNGHASYGESYTLPSGKFADNFHIFSLEWDNQLIKAYMDDIHYFTINITPASLSEFHHNFFIILNVAVGGTWPGPPNATTSFPQTMQVDYVRVYQETAN